MAAELWDADPTVCCAAYQLGACVHTEAITEDELDELLAMNEREEAMTAPTITTRTLASGRTVYVDVETGLIVDTPAEVRAEVRHDCDGYCNGTGHVKISGRVENGRFIGKEGICYRCNGKGWMNEADRKRNWGYDSFYRKVYP